MSKKDKGQAAVYNIVAFNFDGKDTAKETIKQAKKAGALDGYDIVVEAIVEQDEKGKVHLHEPGQWHYGWGRWCRWRRFVGIDWRPGRLVSLDSWRRCSRRCRCGKYFGRPSPKGI